jgi:hypothetical protein
MVRCVRHAAAAFVAAMGLAACGGGGGTSPVQPQPSAPPAPVAASERAALQAALLVVQLGTVATVSPNQTVLGRRRAAARRTALDVACNAGFSEKDTTPSQFAPVHRVQSLYYDAGCTQLRQVVTIDDAFGVDTDNQNGSAVSYDRAGAATDYQTILYFYFASGGGVVALQTTDARTSGGTPFGNTDLLCIYNAASAARMCSAAAAIAGNGFDDGAILQITPTSGGASLQLTPYTGSPGSLAVNPAGFPSAPTLSGGTAQPVLTGTLTLTAGFPAPSALTLNVSGGGEQISGSLSNGTVTLHDGAATVTVDANGNGTVQYSGGAVERVVNYRDIG